MIRLILFVFNLRRPLITLIGCVTITLAAGTGQAQLDLNIQPAPPFEVTSVEGLSEMPRLCWTGSLWGIAWADERGANRSVYYRAVNPADLDQYGEVFVSDEVRDDSSHGEIDLAWGTSDQRVIIVYTDDPGGDSTLLTARLRDNGTVNESDQVVVVLGDDFIAPRIAADGNEYGIAWESDSFTTIGEEVYFIVVDEDGDSQSGLQVRATEDRELGSSVRTPAIAKISGDDYGVAWPHEDSSQDSFDMYYAQMDADGEFVTERRITDTGEDAANPDMIWTGSRNIVVWDERYLGSNDVFLAQLESDGNRIGDIVNVSDTSQRAVRSTVAANGDYIFVVWEEGAENFSRLTYSILDHDGNVAVINTPLLTPSGGIQAYQRPHMRWNGERFGLAFQARRDSSTTDIFFVEIEILATHGWLLR